MDAIAVMMAALSESSRDTFAGELHVNTPLPGAPIAGLSSPREPNCH